MQVAGMTEELRELMALLQDEAEVYRALLAAVLREREALGRSQAEVIRSVGTEKQGLLQRLQSLEDRRRQMVETLAHACGCRPEEVTVSRVATRAPAALRGELLRCRDALLEITDRFRVENRRTELLLTHAGELLHSSYRVLKGLAARCGPVYQRGGRLQGTRLHGKLVCNNV